MDHARRHPAPGEGEGDIEAPASCSILAAVVGSYTVTGAPAVDDNPQRGFNTADHQRGTIEVATDFAIVFDTGTAFAGRDIAACFDRTNQDFDRRIQVSYGADDDAPVINIYLDGERAPVEVQFRHNTDGINVRALVAQP